MRRAKLIKREQGAKQSRPQEVRQNDRSQLEAQAPALTAIAAVQAEVQVRMSTSKHQKREQAREHFNNLFTPRP